MKLLPSSTSNAIATAAIAGAAVTGLWHLIPVMAPMLGSVIGGIRPPVQPVPLTVALGGTGSTTGSAGPYVQLQASTPGTAQTGNLNVSGTASVGALTGSSDQDLYISSGYSDVGIQLGTLNTSVVTLGASNTPVNLSGATVVAVSSPAAVATTGTNASQTISITSQAGGASNGGTVNNTGGNGSNDAWASGAGGVASGSATGTNTGGNGGLLSLTSGAGAASSGATTANIGGTGGGLVLGGGLGGAVTGAGTTNTGGAAGTVALTGNSGGAASGGTTNNGGAGGGLTLAGGAGGSGTQTGGAGGTVAITAGNAGTGGNAAAGNITITPGTATGSGAAGSITLGRAVAAARAGIRFVASRFIDANKPTAAVDCAGGAINATVTQLLDGSIFTCATAQTLTLPTWQGASGTVQALPGTPAIGDLIHFTQVSTAAGIAFTLAAGTGGTIVGPTIVYNGGVTWTCRLTNVTNNSEAATCYGGMPPQEGFINAYSSTNVAATVIFHQTTITNAATIVAGSNLIHDAAGTGTGTFVAKVCSDGATCAGGNVYLTCTAGANCATAAAGRVDACTITKSAIPAGTTLTWGASTACGTTDPAVAVVLHYTVP